MRRNWGDSQKCDCIFLQNNTSISFAKNQEPIRCPWGLLLEHDILIPQPQADMLLREAAEREVSAEELLAEIIKKYIERNERNGG